MKNLPGIKVLSLPSNYKMQETGSVYPTPGSNKMSGTMASATHQNYNQFGGKIQ